MIGGIIQRSSLRTKAVSAAVSIATMPASTLVCVPTIPSLTSALFFFSSSVDGAAELSNVVAMSLVVSAKDVFTGTGCQKKLQRTPICRRRSWLDNIALALPYNLMESRQPDYVSMERVSYLREEWMD